MTAIVVAMVTEVVPLVGVLSFTPVPITEGTGSPGVPIGIT